MTRATLAALLLALAAAPAAARDLALQAVQAWSRPAAAGGAGVGYLTLVNRGKADVLVGADSPVAERVEMHASSLKGGVMSMAAEARTPVPAGGRVSFAPGGRHLMLVGLKRPLRLGEHVPATLRFASGRTLQASFVVQIAPPPGAAPTGGHEHMSGHMSGMAGMPGM